MGPGAEAFDSLCYISVGPMSGHAWRGCALPGVFSTRHATKQKAPDPGSREVLAVIFSRSSPAVFQIVANWRCSCGKAL